ncbi:MAG TPA: hypothetical protein VFY71_10970 [Planctomycetota bacterium]|nr:hypothetical protein [Planctomycetota bacterium]
MRRLSLLATAVAGVALCAAPVPAQDRVKAGNVPEFTFNKPVDNALGITSLESFRGHPTLFEFWGTY